MKSATPDTQAIPENRTGTKSYRAYAKFALGDYCSQAGTIVRATQRQQKKALNLCIAEIRAKKVKGRVQRALVRAYTVNVYEAAESQYYGHP